MADGDTHVCLICGHSKFEEEMFTWVSSYSPKSPSICQDTPCLQTAYNYGLLKPRFMRDVEDMWQENPYLLTEQPLRLNPMAINQGTMVR